MGKEEAKAERVLLPQNAKPLHYNVTLTPNMLDFRFDGEVIQYLNQMHCFAKLARLIFVICIWN